MYLAGRFRMELIDLNKPINKIDTDNAFSRPLSARKVKRIIKRVAKNNNNARGSSVVKANKSNNVIKRDVK